jgi:hypothetical protein
VTSKLAASGPGWQARLLRLTGCDRNPLRRTSERVQAWLTLLVIAGCLPLALAVAGYAGLLAHQAGVRAQHAPRPWQVRAVLLTTAPAARPVAKIRVPVRWLTGSIARTALVPVPPSTAAGTTVRVWVDPGGHLASPPPTDAQLNTQVLATKMSAAVLTAGLAVLSLWPLRWYLTRRRLAQWDSDWRSADRLSAR